MREKIILICSKCLNRNYTIFKNKITQKKQLEINKFCKKCNKHINHKEIK